MEGNGRQFNSVNWFDSATFSNYERAETITMGKCDILYNSMIIIIYFSDRKTVNLCFAWKYTFLKYCL